MGPEAPEGSGVYKQSFDLFIDVAKVLVVAPPIVTEAAFQAPASGEAIFAHDMDVFAKEVSEV